MIRTFLSSRIHIQVQNILLFNVYRYYGLKLQRETFQSTFDKITNKSSKVKYQLNDLFKEIVEREEIDEEQFDEILTEFNRGKLYDLTIVFYEEILHQHTKLRTNQYKYVLLAYNRLNKIEEIEELITEMKNRNVQFDNFIYNILLLHYGQLHQFEKMEEIFEENKKPDISTYGTMLNVYCTAKNEQRIQELIEDMKSRKISWNLVIYNTLLNFYSKVVPNTQQINSLMEQMVSDNIQPDLTTITIISENFAKNKQYEDLYAFFTEIKKKFEKLDAVIIHSFLTHFAKAKKLEIVEEIFQYAVTTKIVNPLLFDVVFWFFFENNLFVKYKQYFELIKELGLRPNAHHYNNLVNIYIKENNLDKIKEIHLEMDQLNINDVSVYNKLLSFYSDRRDFEGIEDIVYNLPNFPANSFTFTTLIHSFASQKNHERVDQLLTEMNKLNLIKTVRTYTTLLLFYKRLGKLDKFSQLFNEMKEKQDYKFISFAIVDICFPVICDLNDTEGMEYLLQVVRINSFSQFWVEYNYLQIMKVYHNNDKPAKAEIYALQVLQLPKLHPPTLLLVADISGATKNADLFSQLKRIAKNYKDERLQKKIQSRESSKK